SANAAFALPHHSRPGNPKREEHGLDRAESGRDRRGGNRSAAFRSHCRASRRRERRVKASEVANGGDRGGQAVRSELAAASANTENARAVFRRAPSLRSAI